MDMLITRDVGPKWEEVEIVTSWEEVAKVVRTLADPFTLGVVDPDSLKPIPRPAWVNEIWKRECARWEAERA